MEDAVRTSNLYGYETSFPEVFIVSIGLAQDNCLNTLRSLGRDTLQSLLGAQIHLFDDNPTDEVPDPSSTFESETCSLREIPGGETIAPNPEDDVKLTLTQTWYNESVSRYRQTVDFEVIYGAVIEEATDVPE